MKKTLFALLAVIFSSSIYAAQFDWAFEAEGYDPFPSKTYYAINGDISSYITTLTTVGQGYDSFVTSLLAGTYATGALNDDGYAEGVLTNAASSFGIIVFESTTAGSTFYYQVANTAGYTYELPSSSENGVLKIWAFDEDYNLDMSTGKVAAVPEPTVLALLALGVAGVALRRKKVVA